MGLRRKCSRFWRVQNTQAPSSSIESTPLPTISYKTIGNGLIFRDTRSRWSHCKMGYCFAENCLPNFVRAMKNLAFDPRYFHISVNKMRRNLYRFPQHTDLHSKEDSSFNHRCTIICHREFGLTGTSRLGSNS